jgi:hypothetical protein
MPAPRLPHYLVEWYRPEPTSELLAGTTASLEHAAASVSADGFPIRLLMTLAVPTDEVIFGVFAASSAQLIERVCHLAGLPAQRLVEAVSAHLERAGRQEPMPAARRLEGETQR